MMSSGMQMVYGYMTIPTVPGWGADLDEDVARAHPWESTSHW